MFGQTGIVSVYIRPELQIPEMIHPGGTVDYVHRNRMPQGDMLFLSGIHPGLNLHRVDFGLIPEQETG